MIDALATFVVPLRDDVLTDVIAFLPDVADYKVKIQMDVTHDTSRGSTGSRGARGEVSSSLWYSKHQ